MPDEPGGVTISLPWPPKELSPNARLHWRALDRAKKSYKAACIATLLDQPCPAMEPGRIPLAVVFHPPDRRRRDKDNAYYSAKYAFDMLARHLGVDDYEFDPSYSFGDPVPGGRVTVTL